MLLVERHHHTGNPEILRLCQLSKELYNKCNFLMRQAWFGGRPLPDINVLVVETQPLDCFQNLHNTKTAKQTIRKALNDWSNFRKALTAYNKDSGKFLRKPKPPYYKDKLAQVVFYNETIKKKPLKQGIITPTNECFSIKSNREFRQVVITPKTYGFVIEVQYEAKQEKAKVNKDKVCCIDLGLNNLCAITSDQHAPVLVNGRIVKSINQWYNKFPSDKRRKKRDCRLENYFHHVSRFVVDYCVDRVIGRIIIGKNGGWKSGMNLGKKTNQNFQYIPFERLIQKIQYKAAMVGIEVVLTEEAYTSQSSFLDNDPLPMYERGVKHEFSGKRIHRGLYRSRDGFVLNADVNGSLNIGRKVIGESFGIADRSIAAMPVVINPLICSLPCVTTAKTG
jgi:putative transposase